MPKCGPAADSSGGGAATPPMTQAELQHLACERCEAEWTRPKGIGGTTPKYCQACRTIVRKATRDKWNAANPEKVLAAKLRYEHAHKDAQDERRRKWGLANHERRREYIKQWKSENRDRINERSRVRRDFRRKEDPEAMALQRKKWMLRSNYNLEISDYDRIMEAQNQVCAICFDPPDRPYGFHVDHNHNTGEVRGLLCGRCNPMIGLARESQGVLASAIEYLNLNEGEDA